MKSVSRAGVSDSWSPIGAFGSVTESEPHARTDAMTVDARIPNLTIERRMMAQGKDRNTGEQRGRGANVAPSSDRRPRRTVTGNQQHWACAYGPEHPVGFSGNAALCIEEEPCRVGYSDRRPPRGAFSDKRTPQGVDGSAWPTSVYARANAVARELMPHVAPAPDTGKPPLC